MITENLNCSGSGPHMGGEVRVMPTGGGGNMIFCQRCWSREIAWRRERNRELGAFAQYDLPDWLSAEVSPTS